MTRALDHIVWPTRDLDGLAGCFRDLGFTVGRRNRHPWGTENHIVQFDGAFLELLGFAGDYETVSPDAQSFPFAGFCDEFLAAADAGAGAAMLVLRSDDANADASRLRRMGIGHGRLLSFSRAAQGPDGADRTVAFTIAFADLPGLPEVGAFLCQHHRPENFWNAAAQHHANGAAGFASITILGPEPDAHAQALRAFADDDGAGWEIILEDGSRLVLGRSAKSAVSAVTIEVADLAALEAMLVSRGGEGTAAGLEMTVRAPALGHTALIFSQPRR